MRASTFGMGKRHVPMPPEQGRLDEPLFELRSRALAGRLHPVLQPGSCLRGLVETKVDLRSVNSDISQFTAVEVTQSRHCRMTLTLRDRGSDHTVDTTAHARKKNGKKNGGSSPGNWRGGRG
jgi:hypothetical protein